MAYLIDQQIWWLLATIIFGGIVGWAVHAFRTQEKDDAQLRERDRVLRDLLATAGDGAGGEVIDLESRTGFMQRQVDLNLARIAELEASLETARARAEEATGRVAELERSVDRDTANVSELNALRAQLAALEQEKRQIVDVSPVVAANDDDSVLQAWRLRYFEQRVRYLESQERPALALPSPEAIAEAPPAPDMDMPARWSARYYAARTAYLEAAAREASKAPTSQYIAAEPVPTPSPENQDLMRWRMRYLEKRVEYLQAQPVAAPEGDGADHELDAARFKWRARYLEARVRHLESRPAPVVAPVAPILEPEPDPQPVAATDVQVRDERPTPVPLVPAGSEERPPALPAARQGAPDDLSLIDGVSMLQQSTLNSLGIYHFDQIAAWTPANVAWVDQYLRLRGRIGDEEWVEQAAILVREGPLALRHAFESEPA